MRWTDDGPFGSTAAFLDSKILFSRDAHGQDICSVVSGGETVGVMMGWEGPISTFVHFLRYWPRSPEQITVESTVNKLCHTHPMRSSGLRVLNIGFGLGIVSRFRSFFLLKAYSHRRR